MMLVKILEFGSNWWARFGSEPSDPWRFTRRACYYNSTGVRSGRKVRRHWVIPGLIRFNGTGDFNPHLPLRSIGQTFSCGSVVENSDGNRLVIEGRVHTDSVDYFLTVVASDRHGRVDFSRSDCKSPTVLPIAVSQLRDRQEGLVLMQSTDWILSSVGMWQLVIGKRFLHGASLNLQAAPVVY